MKLNPYLKDFWKQKKQIKVLYGGRMSSKSYDTAGVLLFLASTYKLRILCIRRYQNKIDESVYALLKEIILNEPYFKERFTILKSSIVCNTTGSEFIFFGLHRSIDEVVGLQGINITWIEEAHTLQKKEWDRLRPTILRTGGGGFCVLVFNPQNDTDYVYKNFVMSKREDTLVQMINYTDNPFLNKESKELIRIDKENLTEDDFNHIYLGYPKAENENSFIKRAWIEACIDANSKLGIENRGKYKIGYDIADAGNDACAMVGGQGNEVDYIEEWKAKEDELEQSAKKVFDRAKLNDSEIVYDCIGVGASAGSSFKRLNIEEKEKNRKHRAVTYSKFDAGAKVINPDKLYQPQRKNKDHFENLKAQAWQDIADRMLKTYKAVVKGEKFNEDDIISISSKCDKLEELKIELSAPLKEESRRGLVKVESKDDMKKRGIPSPNCFVEGTKILTPNGEVNIELLKVGDEVITPMGISRITHTHKNYASNVITNMGLTGTANHKIFTWNGWKELQFLSLCDIIETSKIGRLKWQIMNLLYTKAKCSQFSTQVDTFVQGDTEEKTLEMSDFYTEGYGLSIMGKFLKGITFIILMATGVITKLATLKWLKPKSIIDYIWKRDLKTKSTKKKTDYNFWQHKKKQKSGTVQKRAKSGIENMLSNSLKKENTKHMYAKSAKMNLNQEEHMHQVAALKNAQPKEQMKKPKQDLHQNAETVEKCLHMGLSEKMKNTKDVQENAHLPSKRIVYNITLDKHNVYYANGVLVKNCADAFIMRYAQIKTTTRFTSDML